MPTPSPPVANRPIVSPEDALAALAALAGEIAGGRRMAVLGLCGPQGSGKSTLAAGLARRLPHTVTLSLDDLYLTHAERVALAARVHPLFATRGVPGTHDVALGLDTIAALARGEPAALPRFDKAADDRLPVAEWPRAPVGCRLLVLEGWCVGAVPEPPEALATPLNRLEREEDGAAVWRTHANAALAGYGVLWSRLDRLALLVPPSVDTVLGWRREQEHALRRRASGSAKGVMDDAGVARFVMHYERLTRHLLAEMPGRADLTVVLDAERRAVRIRRGSTGRSHPPC